MTDEQKPAEEQEETTEEKKEEELSIPTLGLSDEEIQQLRNFIITITTNHMSSKSAESTAGQNIGVGIIAGATILAKQFQGPNAFDTVRLQILAMLFKGLQEPLHDLVKMIRGIREEQEREAGANEQMNDMLTLLKEAKAKYDTLIAKAQGDVPEQEKPKPPTEETNS